MIEIWDVVYFAAAVICVFSALFFWQLWLAPFKILKERSQEVKSFPH